MKVQNMSFVELGLLLSLVIILVVIIYKVVGGNLENLLANIVIFLEFK